MKLRLLTLSFALVLLPGAVFAQAPVRVTIPGVRVDVAPPPPQVEVRPAPPGPGHVWIAGHWAWRHRRHFWVPGHWEMAPAPGYVWEPARWVNEGGHWVFFEGHWRVNDAPTPTAVYEPAAAPSQEVEVEEQPPEPIAEARAPEPFAGAVWIPGYWHWNGHHHTWIAGRYSAPRPGYVWEPHHWKRHGHRWVMVPGRWHKR